MLRHRTRCARPCTGQAASPAPLPGGRSALTRPAGLAALRAEPRPTRRSLEFVGDLTALLAKERDLTSASTRPHGSSPGSLRRRHHAHRGAAGIHGPHGPPRRPGDARTTRHHDPSRPRGRRTPGPDSVAREVDLGSGVPSRPSPWPSIWAPGRRAASPCCGVGPRPDDGGRFLLSLRVHAPRRRGSSRRCSDAKRRAGRWPWPPACSEALEGRGTLYRGHAGRVAALARRMAGTLGLSPRLPEVIQTPPASATSGGGRPRRGPDPTRAAGREQERPAPRAPRARCAILAPFGEAAAFVRHHHERPDGNGYPGRTRRQRRTAGCRHRRGGRGLPTR